MEINSVEKIEPVSPECSDPIAMISSSSSQILKMESPDASIPSVEKPKRAYNKRSPEVREKNRIKREEYKKRREARAQLQSLAAQNSNPMESNNTSCSSSSLPNKNGIKSVYSKKKG